MLPVGLVTLANCALVDAGRLVVLFVVVTVVFQKKTVVQRRFYLCVIIESIRWGEAGW
jgi:hypothetical protein